VKLPLTHENFSMPRMVSWATTGGLAVLDQGLFAGANFAANVLLARWLSPGDYGAFAIGFSSFVFANMCHTALIVEPMMVFGPGKYLSRFECYLGILLRAEVGVALAFGVLLSGVALLAGWINEPIVGWALGGAAIATPCILVLWLARRAFYVGLRPAWSAIGGAVYLVTFLVSIGALRHDGLLSPATALVAMGGAALAATIPLIVKLGPKWRVPKDGPRLREVASDHWRYGRWALGSGPVAWFPGNIYFVLLPVWFGLAEAGALKALVNFAMPVLQSITAVGGLVLTTLVRHRTEGGLKKVSSTLRRFVVALFWGAALYAAIVWIFRLQALHFLYGGKYTQYAFWPFLLVCLLCFVACASLPFEVALRAFERPDLVFRSSLFSAGAAVICGVPLTAAFGLNGALIGMVASWSVLGFSSFWLYRRLLVPSEGAAAPTGLGTAVETP
jgi:O-antigen/teichoic acid export membrane protein